MSSWCWLPAFWLSVCRLSWISAFTLLSSTVVAHDSRPVFIQTEIQDAGEVLLRWRVPDSVETRDVPRIALEAPCVNRNAEQFMDGARAGEVVIAPAVVESLLGERRYRCPSEAGVLRVSIHWPRQVPSLSVLLRHQPANGGARTVHASPGTVEVAIPGDMPAAEVFHQYLVLGIEHIAAGFDHLLFVACLVMLAGTWRRIVVTVSGFTVAHSITLAAATFDALRLPLPPVETAITLSILFLAAEIARDRRDTLTWRYPALVASCFGFLHGFGFAAVLSEIGLPADESGWALLSFNLGVECGQLLFVALLLGLSGLFRWLRTRRAGGAPIVADLFRFNRIAAYPVGVVAMFWTLERFAAWI
jgi:hydrogenase/urease accessory protein HupE